jgi:GTP-binding protein
MKVVRAECFAAAVTAAQIPRAKKPEIAVAGRSNVGKSSLINRLVGRKSLARTSATPGCTRGLVFFDINDRLTLVDLPGYGWASRSRQERDGWKGLVETYLEGRTTLAGLLVLIDVRRGPEEEEQMLAAYLDARRIPFAWVLTKSDKLGRTKTASRLAALEPELGGRPAIATSARTGDGIEAVWRWSLGAIEVLEGRGPACAT